MSTIPHTIPHTIQHTIQHAYKTELDLNNEQITACKRQVGVARWASNGGLAREQEAYHATGTSPSARELHRDLNALKPIQLPWRYEVSKGAPQEALRNLDIAFARFFRQLGHPAALAQKAEDVTVARAVVVESLRMHDCGNAAAPLPTADARNHTQVS
jgi:hypothetical protein